MIKFAFMDKIRNYIEYAIAGLVVFDCNTIYLELFPKTPVLLASIILFVLLALFSLTKRKQSYISPVRTLIFVCFYIAYMAIMLLYMDYTRLSGYLYRMMFIIPIFIVYFSTFDSHENQRYSLFFKFSQVMSFLAAISLIMWLCASILGLISPSSSVFIEWLTGGFAKTEVNSYYHIYYETQQTDIFSLGIIRNTGVFLESPMYSFCLCFALLIELFLKEKKRKWCVVLLFITIMTTISVTGYVCLMLILIFFFFLRRGYGEKNIILRLFRFTVFVLLTFVFVNIFNSLMEEKKKERISYEEREDNAKSVIDVWKSSPLFGAGYERNISNSSNSIFVLLADGGVYLFVIYFYAFCVFPYMVFLKNRDNRLLVMFFILFIIFCVTVVLYRMLILMLIGFAFSGLCRKAK